MMTFLLDLRIAWLSVLAHRKRLAFLGGAIAAVTVSVVFLSALSAGVRASLVETGTTLSTGDLNIAGYYKISPGQVGPLVLGFEKLREVARATLPETAYTVERGRDWAKLVSDTGSIQAAINGVDVEREGALGKTLRLQSGSWADLAQPGTILLFASQAAKLGVRTGDALTLLAETNRGVANTLDCRVAAVAEDLGLISQWTVFVPNRSLRDLYQLRDDVTGTIQIHLQPGHEAQLEALAAKLRAGLEHAGYEVQEPDRRPFWMKLDSAKREAWTGQRLDVTTWQDELSFMTWPIQTLDALSTLVVLVLGAIVVTGIMNALWIAIRERTREIGALRAIGMQRWSVVRLFLFESLLLGVLGSGLGIALGQLVGLVLNAAQIRVPVAVQMFLMSNTLRLVVEPSALLATGVAIATVAAAAAVYPALRASRLKPIDALSHFG
jgi:putative ABC transport system permease protein